MIMALTQAQYIEVVLISVQRSNYIIAKDFNQRHPNRTSITYPAMLKLFTNFLETLFDSEQGSLRFK